ncbi:uncharacterized membrane protein C3orf80 homolog [Amia ocellicauda]|uniref:uncharacterized membrane protein C3orf80 homolog n=1 Tax=Amia ocellicauda TaxID=2972642 RepID=UPI003464E8D7
MLHLSNDITPGFTLLTLCVIYAFQATRNCGGTFCREDQRCCPLGNSSSEIRCCKLPLHTFFDNVGWITRKLSGILILLLLFAMGYFIQRIICPRPRRHHERQDDPSLLNGHTTASQDSLIDRLPEHRIGAFTSPVLQLPAYDEVKYLPTYEETMQVDRDRSDDNLLSAAGQTEETAHTASDTRTSWNSV